VGEGEEKQEEEGRGLCTAFSRSQNTVLLILLSLTDYPERGCECDHTAA